MKTLIITIIIPLIFIIEGCNSIENKKCCKGHYEEINHYGYTQMIYVGNNVWVPIFHNGYKSKDFICDKYCK